MHFDQPHKGAKMSDNNFESVTQWAERNFPNGFDLGEGESKLLLLGIILFALLNLFVLLISLDGVFRGKSADGFFIVPVLSAGLIVYLVIRRRRIAIHIDNEGVTTKSGKKLLWSKLLSAEFKSGAKQTVGSSFRIDRENFQTILRFEDGVAIILHRVELEARLLKIPVDKTDSRGNFF